MRRVLMESDVVIERDIKTMSNYLKLQLKKDLEEVMTPMTKSLQEIYLLLEDFRDVLEMHFDALLGSQH